MALPRTQFTSTPDPEFGVRDPIPPHRFPLLEGIVTARPVGNVETGYNPNWRGPTSSRLAIGAREFICREGEYMLLEPAGGHETSRGGAIYLCRGGALERIGSVGNGYHDVDVIVSEHFDPEVARLRRCQREDNIASIRLTRSA